MINYVRRASCMGNHCYYLVNWPAFLDVLELLEVLLGLQVSHRATMRDCCSKTACRAVGLTR